MLHKPKKSVSSDKPHDLCKDKTYYKPYYKPYYSVKSLYIELDSLGKALGQNGLFIY